MPAYDFRCTACDDVFEITRAAGRATDDVCCPKCGAEAKRVFTPVGVVFKGSGFHNTDYKKRPAETGSDTSGCPAKESGNSDGCASCPASSES